MLWHSEKIESVFDHLNSSEDGLSDADAKKHLQKYGRNELKVETEPLWKVIIEPFSSVFVLVLIAAAFVSLISHEKIDAVIIGFIILINSVIFYSQKYTTNKVLKTLRTKSEHMARVLRSGSIKNLPSTEIVPGDIISLSEGMQIPADARLIDSSDLQVDESALTGESKPVHKKTGVIKDFQQIYEQTNMVFQGTYVLGGSARALVVTTGSSTQYGQIADLASLAKEQSPVQQKIDTLVGLLIKIIVLVSVIVLGLSIFRGISNAESLRFALSLAVAAVPEGLPIALTVIIVLGMRRMAKHKALVRSFKAIEDIGLVDAVATDKTGTITKNNLSVVDSWAIGDSNLKEVAAKVVERSDATKDPLEHALAEHTGNAEGTHGRYYPFATKLRMSGAYLMSDKTMYIKGAPEEVIKKSKIPTSQLEQVKSKLEQFTKKGYRVIAIAKTKISNEPEKLDEIKSHKLNLIGLVAFADEVRPQAKTAIKQAKTAGIDVKMITGDHLDTAIQIGEDVGLASSEDQAIEGTHLPTTDTALAKTVSEKTIFARILPKDKFRILEALKLNGKIVAMTGDGVNDVPAIANAHVGIAMRSGSDIAKDAGDIVLLNDNFATIIKAVAEGRKIYDNIRKMVFYMLSSSIGEVTTMIGALLLNLPLPVTAIQILWTNIVTNTALDLPLGLEPAEHDQMEKPPRKSNEPLLGRIIMQRVFIIGFTMAAVEIAIVAILVSRNHQIAYIQTVAFMALIAAQWMNAFNARSEKESFFERIRNHNKAMYVGLSIAVFLQAMVMFGPLKGPMGIVDVPLATLALSCAIMMAFILAASEIHKVITKNHEG